MTADRWDVGFISCSSSKNPSGQTARTLYRGAIFITQFRHALQRCNEVVIVSAKYGLLRPDDHATWYDQYLGNLSPAEMLRWKAMVASQLKPFDPGRWSRRLSYLPIMYQSAVEEACPELFPLRSPYRIRAITQISILSKEIKNYGQIPSRRG